MKWIVIFAASLLALACARNAPYLSGADLEGRVRSTVPGADGASEVFPNAAWYPYMDGYAYVRTGEGGGRHGFFKGAIVLTGEALLFVIHDEDLQRLEVVKRIPYADVRSVEVDHLGLGTLVVVRQPRRVVHSFGFAPSEFADPIAAEPARRAAAAMKLRLAQARRPS